MQDIKLHSKKHKAKIEKGEVQNTTAITIKLKRSRNSEGISSLIVHCKL